MNAGRSERVLRLHILANSDSEEDQQLKLQVRDAVVAASAGLFDGVQDEGEALERAGSSFLFWRKRPGRSSLTPAMTTTWKSPCATCISPPAFTTA